jgi:membrane-associated phospholipid phosphatase
VDRLVAAYLLLAAPPLLLPGRPGAWWALLAAHAVGIAACLFWAPAAARRGGRARATRVAAFVAEWYPLLVMPLLYSEVALLNEAVWGGRFFDSVVMGWEEALFGGQPSAWLARRFPSLLLSETLHLAYIAYFPLIFFPPAALYFAGRLNAFRASVLTLMVGFLAGYVVFTYFPVQGPRYLFPPPAGGLEAGVFYRFAHTLLESGSSRGAAFPSAHAAVAAVQAVLAFRFLPTWAPLVTAVAAGLSVGAVYGGFHYAIDIIAGLALGLLVAWITPSLIRSARP